MTKPAAPERPPREVLEAFGLAATTALQELTQVEAWIDTGGRVAAASLTPVVSAVVRLWRPLPGTMSLVMPVDTASQLAAIYLPEGTALSDELIDDVAGEFANVIAGQAKTILKCTPYHFTLSPPVVTRAATCDAMSGASAAEPSLSLAFATGRLGLFIELSPCPGA